MFLLKTLIVCTCLNCLQHRLYVLVWIASGRRFERVPTIYVLSINKKNNVNPFKQSFYYLKWGLMGQNYIGIFSWWVSSCGQRGLWSDCVNAPADLSLFWAHMSKGAFPAMQTIWYLHRTDPQQLEVMNVDGPYESSFDLQRSLCIFTFYYAKR